VCVSASVSELPGLSLVDRVMKLLNRVDYRRIETPEDKDSVFRLRYQAYMREGAIAPNASETFSDSLDSSPNASIFGVYLDGKLASSIRLHVASPACGELPVFNVFADILGPQLAAGRTIIDPTRFVADRELSRRYPELCYVTTRLAWLASEYFETDLLLAAVRLEHQAFYRRTFGHQAICPPRRYPLLTKPISLMALEYAASRTAVPRRYPFFHSTHFERRMLFGRETMVALATAA
jgi:N-acyl amino acid synthase FeeM